MQAITTDGWIARTGDQIDRIHINVVSRDVQAGRCVWVKRRTTLSQLLIPVANGFFWVAGNPVKVFRTNAAWLRHETTSFQLLNGSDRAAGALGSHTVYAEELPGADLAALLKKNALNDTIMKIVGAAFRKMHGTYNPITLDWFSHGDPHLGNVLYDVASHRIGWLDFETAHRSQLHTIERHADDLLVLLLDLVGRSDEPLWRSLSPAFLKEYDNPEVISELKKRLHPPRGFGAIWWAVRTSYLNRRELQKRLTWLRDRL